MVRHDRKAWLEFKNATFEIVGCALIVAMFEFLIIWMAKMPIPQ